MMMLAPIERMMFSMTYTFSSAQMDAMITKNMHKLTTTKTTSGFILAVLHWQLRWTG